MRQVSEGGAISPRDTHRMGVTRGPGPRGASRPEPFGTPYAHENLQQNLDALFRASFWGDASFAVAEDPPKKKTHKLTT